MCVCARAYVCVYVCVHVCVHVHTNAHTGRRMCACSVHSLYRCAVLLLDISLDEILAERVELAVPRDFDSCLVPLVHEPMLVDSKDRRIGRVNQTAEVA